MGAFAARVDDALERIARDRSNAFLTVTAERARARVSDAPRGPLHGLVASVKDNLAVRGVRMTCGSRMLERYVPPYTATVVERLEAQGAVVVGKTNLDEFACGSSGERSAFGATENPAAPGRVPGGSSSGAGASLAAGLVDLAVGSDTGGSVRCPASFCGVVGFKPSYGRVSRYGLADMCMSLEGPAPMARDVTRTALLFDAIHGPDPRDPVTLSSRAAPVASSIDTLDGARLRIGVPREFFDGIEPATEAAVRGAIDRFARAGAAIVPVSTPSVALALPAYYLLVYSEFASAMQKFDGLRYGHRGEDGELVASVSGNRAAFGPEVVRRIVLGTYVTMQEHRNAWYTKALAAREAVAADFSRALSDVDVLMAPTMPYPAFRLGERVEDPVRMYAADVLTVSANLAGIPAGSVPIPGSSPPIGLQVMGRRGDDATVLRAMRAYERLAGGSPP
ncbi:MAG: Asp-tRNA(Asn)/Glu-tRNA(Gln) amidotransferase subunit GatA [Methanobacteriota archaeon]